jgi:hypothetical protein
LRSGPLRRDRNSPSCIFLAEAGGEQAEVRRPFHKDLTQMAKIISTCYTSPPRKRGSRGNRRSLATLDSRFRGNDETAENSERTASLFAVFGSANRLSARISVENESWLADNFLEKQQNSEQV